MSDWPLSTAKAKFEELLTAAKERGPQRILSSTGDVFMVARQSGAAPADDTKPKSLLDLLEPVRGLGDDLVLPPREIETPRRFWWDDEAEAEEREAAPRDPTSR